MRLRLNWTRNPLIALQEKPKPRARIHRSPFGECYCGACLHNLASKCKEIGCRCCKDSTL